MRRRDIGYRRRVRRKDREDHILPLINIVFLLLSFFLIAGQIERKAALAVSTPVSLSDRADKRLPISIQIDRDGQIFVDGKAGTIGDLASMVPVEGPDRPILRIHADADVAAPRLLKILSDLRAAGWGKVTLVTVRPVTGRPER